MFWSLLGVIASSLIQAKAAKDAAKAQVGANNQSIGEMRREFDVSKRLSQPYINSGRQALWQQKDILGLNGNQAQQDQLNALMQSPAYQTNVQQSEAALLANASATGGLRGGNTQNSLAKIRPQILTGLEQQRLSNLSNLSAIGQNAAAGTGNAAINTGKSIAGAYGNIGNAQGDAAIAAGKAGAGIATGIFNTLRTYSQQQQQQQLQQQQQQQLYGSRAF